MGLLRQRERGNWAEVMDRVATALAAFINNPEVPSSPELPSSGQPNKMDRVWREQEQQATEQLQQGRLEEAEVNYKTLIEAGAVSYIIFHNLAVICWKQNRRQEAIPLFRKAVAVHPSRPEAHRNLGIALHEQGDLEAAVDAYRQALVLQPDNPDTYNNLGNALKDQDDLQGAVDAYRQALAIDPNFSRVHNNLGIALKDQGDLQAAMDAYRQALAINPNYPEAYSSLGNARKEQGNLQGAIDAYRQALALQPNFAQAHNNLGTALRRQGDLQGAIDAYRQALAINPHYLEALSNLGSALEEQGELQASMEAYRQALAINPNFPDAHWNLSLLQLLSGDYENGWKGYEWRFRKQPPRLPHAYPQLERWSGNHLTPGERLILVSEQGLGDTLHFMRYVLHLNKTGQSASLCAPTKLHGLIQASGITTRIYSPEQTNQLTTGKWLPLASLPGYLQVRPDHPIVDDPYIKVPEQRVGNWQQKLATEERPIIGINWQGNPNTETISLRDRSLPLESFAPIVEKTTVTLLPLQKGHGAEQLAECPFRHRFVNCQEEINQTWDFVETAAMIANCDLVITTDTAVAHLAGGMGRPTSLLLNTMSDTAHLVAGMGQTTLRLLTTVLDWRWGLEGDTSFWYPSMRLFRQREQGNWAAVMDSVATALAAFVSNHQAGEQLQQGRLEDSGRKEEGDLQDGVNACRQVLAINSNLPEAHNNLGIALQKQGDLPAAMDAHRQALAISPNFPGVGFNLGVALEKQGDLEAAIKSYRQALAVQPNFPDAQFNLASALLDSGDLQGAIVAFRSGIGSFGLMSS